MKKNKSPQEIAENARRAYQEGDFSGASLAYREAAAGFIELGDPLMAAEMKNNQSVALLRNKQAEAALEAARGTERFFSEVDDHKRQGIALANQASALEALKRSSEAIELYNRAGEALKEANEMEMRLEIMQLLSALHLKRFKFFDAIIALQSGLGGIKNPTPKQRLMKKLLFIRF